MLVTFRELLSALRDLGIAPHLPVIAHTSVPAFGEIRGGADTLLGALLTAVDTAMLPAFTYKTTIIPEAGPPENALVYGSGNQSNLTAEIYTPTLPADEQMGPLPERLRLNPDALRSRHPILSFVGLGVDAALQKQTLEEPLAPIQKLAEMNGWVMLLGIDQTANTSIHLAERLAGRRQFVRWALMDQKVVRCPGMPGCSRGFNSVAEVLSPITRKTILNAALIQAIPLQPMLDILTNLMKADPLALLCEKTDCPYCTTIRRNLPQT